MFSFLEFLGKKSLVEKRLARSMVGLKVVDLSNPISPTKRRYSSRRPNAYFAAYNGNERVANGAR